MKSGRGHRHLISKRLVVVAAAAETGEQDFDPRRAEGSGAAVEMDRNGAVELTSYQKRHAQRRRAKQRAQAPD